MRTFPPDVIVLDTDTLTHARLSRGGAGLQIAQAKSYRLAADTFTPAVVTPNLTNEGSLADGLRRMKLETGKWDKVSVLLPDSWFRINIIDLPSLAENASEAMEMVRWSLKRTIPIPPESLRVAWTVLSKTSAGVKLLVLSAIEKALKDLERLFAAAGLDIILVEPIGLNIWNAVTVREPETASDRLFLYVRDNEFTTAMFRGNQPLFIRSRNLSEERTLDQEIRLSASYLRDTLRTETIEQCYVAGNRVEREVTDFLIAEFAAPVKTIALRDFVQQAPSDFRGADAELVACTGVFTG